MDYQQVYPYETDSARHPCAWMFFNVPGVARFDLDSADTLAKHVFDSLGCGMPGSVHSPKVHYDALGSSGGPWEPGEWKGVDEPRLRVRATAPEKDVTAMSAEERAELRAALEAAEDAARAGAVDFVGDEMPLSSGVDEESNSDEKGGV